MKSNLLLFILLAVTITSCEVAPQKINYGADACHYCDMTIVDRQHASQIVTAKGKAFNYDAIECMVHSLQQDMDKDQVALFLVADFDNPGNLMDATKSGYLVSENIQSPMGENLSAFKDEAATQKAQKEYSGKIFSWESIQTHLEL